MVLFFKYLLVTVFFCVQFLFVTFASAETVYEMLEKVVAEHELIQAAEARKDAAGQVLKQSRGAWYPQVTALANIGRQNIDPAAGALNTRENRNIQNIRTTQLLYDFGRTGAGVERSEAGLERSKFELAATRQDIILRGVTAYLDVYRHNQRLKLARQSERRIVQLTGIEETLVTKGAGLASDVLQAKSQLAGAKAVRVQAEGEFNNAMNRFRTVFGYSLTDGQIQAMVVPPRPEEHIPANIDEAVSIAAQNSFDLNMADKDIEMAEHEIRFRQSMYYPTLNLVGEANRKENDDGVRGTRRDVLGMVELNWTLFSGGRDRAAVNQARYILKDTEKRKEDLEHLVQERVRTAWRNMLTSRENARFLRDQADIMEEFLKLAKRERKLGTRSLLDVLSGEVTHLNALSNAISADIDHELALYNMLYAMGKLELDRIK